MKQYRPYIFMAATLLIIVAAMIFRNSRTSAPQSATSTTDQESDVSGKVVDPKSKAQAALSQKKVTENDQVDTKVNAPTSDENQIIVQELEEVRRELPSMNHLKTLNEDEVHHTPDMITNGGKLIGKVIAQAQENPARREETLKFLLSCAEDEELAAPIRALAWKKTTSKIAEWKIMVPIADANIPPDIQDLANKLP